MRLLVRSSALLSDVLYVPGLSVNLLLVKKVSEEGSRCIRGKERRGKNAVVR